MNIQSVRLYSFELKLRRPIIVRGRTHVVRQGFILELQAGSILGYGEISPLEGFSVESLEDVQQQIKQLRYFLLSDPVPDKVEYLEGRFQDWLGNFALHSSVACGLEMAILNLTANSRKITLKELLAETSHCHIPINGLLQGEPALVLEQARQMVAEGFTALKLKVGSSLESDIKMVRAVSEAIGGKALLHLDANRSWSLDEAIYFGTQVGLASVDYIEEPLSTYEEIPEFFRQTTIPVALDESLADISFDNIKSLDGVDVLVLKPSRIGGIERTWRLMREAKAQGINTLISSIFESSLGLLTLANLAGCSFRNNAAGLDTGKWFETDLLNQPLSIRRGRMDIDLRQVNTGDINFEHLTEIQFS